MTSLRNTAIAQDIASGECVSSRIRISRVSRSLQFNALLFSRILMIRPNLPYDRLFTVSICQALFIAICSPTSAASVSDAAYRPPQ
jgi:hypothetical protein